MRKPDISGADPPESPPDRPVRRTNWPLIVCEEIWTSYEGIWNYCEEIANYRWTWRHALLLLIFLAHLPS
jgi:hypothetical protein